MGIQPNVRPQRADLADHGGAVTRPPAAASVQVRLLSSRLVRKAINTLLWLPQHVRRTLVTIVQLLIAVASTWLAFNLRFDSDIPPVFLKMFLGTLPWLLFARGVTFFFLRLDEGIWRYVGLWDLRRIAVAVATSSVVLYGCVRWGYGTINYPRSIFLIDSALLLIFLGAFRLAPRIYRDIVRVKGERRLLIYGAGDTGDRALRELQQNRASLYDVIGFVDDDASKVGERMHGVPVLGTTSSLAKIVGRLSPEEILVAIPNASPALLRRIVTTLEPFNVAITTVVSGANGGSPVSVTRSLSIEDLLSRQPAGLGIERVRQLVAGRRVLVTGAGGSIGSELSRQISGLDPESLVLFERHENSLYTVANSIHDAGPTETVHSVIGDITDEARLNAVFLEYRPQIVFHAAAHKHVPLMEINPCEAVKNNVTGTRMVAEAAARYGAERFILISTDKAVNPSSVMGTTKRIAEMVLHRMSERTRTRFIAVRFGNVLGSAGSVLLRFQDQIKAGGPVTVTDPHIKRYFMLIPEAVELVLHAAAVGAGGDTLVLDMGEQIRVLDLARNLISLSGHVPDEEIPIVFTGLRPGEKLFEELAGDSELMEPSPVDKIRRIVSMGSAEEDTVEGDLMELERCAADGDTDAVMLLLRHLVPGFRQVAALQSV